MDEKANKGSVSNALHRKSNKTDHQALQKEVRTKFTDVTEKLDKMLKDLSNFFKENKTKNKLFDDAIANLNKEITKFPSTFKVK